jgi:hypothetical protein
MKAKREQKKKEQIVIKLFSRNYARDLMYIILICDLSFLSTFIIKSDRIINER